MTGFPLLKQYTDVYANRIWKSFLNNNFGQYITQKHYFKKINHFQETQIAFKYQGSSPNISPKYFKQTQLCKLFKIYQSFIKHPANI